MVHTKNNIGPVFNIRIVNNLNFWFWINFLNTCGTDITPNSCTRCYMYKARAYVGSCSSSCCISLVMLKLCCALEHSIESQSGLNSLLLKNWLSYFSHQFSITSLLDIIDIILAVSNQSKVKLLIHWITKLYFQFCIIWP